MPEVPDDATVEEFESLRMLPGMGRRPVADIVRGGEPPIFREHGRGRGNAHVAVRAGYWKLICPMCFYAEQSALDERGQRLEDFVCARCQNGAAGGRVLGVLWPTREQQEKIEMVLRERPDLAARNWQFGESIQQLAVENLMHGCAVPQLLPVTTIPDGAALNTEPGLPRYMVDAAGAPLDTPTTTRPEEPEDGVALDTP